MARNRQARYASAARQVAAKYGIPVRLFLSLIDHESGWNPHAVSHAGAVGLTQLMPTTAQGLKVDPFDPRQNLDGGARYLHTQYQKLGSWKDALRAYNVGPNGIKDPNAGLDYANSVLAGRNAAKFLDAPGQPGMKQPMGTFNTLPVSMTLAQMTKALFPGNKQMLRSARALGTPGQEFQLGAPAPTTPIGGVGTAPLVSIMPSDNVGARAVKYAATQLGKPYQFGSGPSTASFDCSDLVQWAYKQLGINIPRDTYGQMKALKPKSWANLLPGDPIYRRSGGHVVIYAGNGKVIAAPHTGTVVQYQDISSFPQSEYVPYSIPH